MNTTYFIKKVPKLEKKNFKKNGFVEILSDFYKKFFKNIFLFYFYFNFQRIILESVFLFYT